MILLLVLILCGCPHVDAKNSVAAPSAARPDQTDKAELVTSTFKVEGMTCDDCSQAIEGKLAGIEGVITVAADHKAGTAIVQYDPRQVTPPQIVAAIDALKFKARLMEDVAVPDGHDAELTKAPSSR
jgi:copper chaperone